MFYGALVLAKKGPLAKVWLAAHWDKKLTKAHVFETDVESTVDSIISPQVKLALRTSGHLLLGVVKIYSRKQKYLMHDLVEACAKIKMAFRPGIVVDLPSDGGADKADAITLPQIFHNFENSVTDLETLQLEAQFTVNPSRASEITIAEDPTTTSGSGDIFGEFGDFNNFDLQDGDFGSTMQEMRDNEENRGDSDFTKTKSTLQIDQSNGHSALEEMDMMVGTEKGLASEAATQDFGGGSDMDIFKDEMISDMSLAPLEEGTTMLNEASDIVHENRVEEMEVDPPLNHKERSNVEEEEEEEGAVAEEPAAAPAEEEGFTLEHVEPARGPSSGVAEEKRVKRKRRLVVDTDKEFTGQQIKSQFDDYKDLLQPKYFPPPTKKAMRWKEMAGCDQLFSGPNALGLDLTLSRMITGNYHVDIPGLPLPESPDISKSTTLEDDATPTTAAAHVTAATPPPELSALEDTTHHDSRGEVAPGALGECDFGGLGDDMQAFEPDQGLGVGGEGAMTDGGDPPAIGVSDENQDPPSTSSRVLPEIPDFDDLPTQSTEEQQSEELSEEFERRRWTKRTQQVLAVLQRGLESSEEVELSLLTRRCNRKQAASRFYTCLLLAKEGMISVTQPEPYGSISIQKGPKLVDV